MQVFLKKEPCRFLIKGKSAFYQKIWIVVVEELVSNSTKTLKSITSLLPKTWDGNHGSSSVNLQQQKTSGGGSDVVILA